MDCSLRVCEGFALAATIARDPGAESASAGLAPELRARLMQLPRELAQASKAVRRDRIRQLAVATPTSFGDQGRRATRGLGLLAPHVELALGRTWLAAAPLPRAGFTPDRALLALLRRVAARAPER